jgi:rhodanese-related sulfurtransferase
MELFFQFVSYQWYWFALLALLVGLLLYYENRKAGPSVTTQQLTSLVNNSNGVVLDVRPAADFRQGHIVDAVNIPHEQVANRLAELEKYRDRPLILVCKMGQHSGAAAKAIRAAGFEQVYRLGGGMMEWTGASLPLVKD